MLDGYGAAMRTLLIPTAFALLTACPVEEEPFDPGPSVERCTDTIDNDQDGAVDCEDADCEPSLACHLGDEDCEDGWDNDLDGLVDCEDADCAPVCSPEICDNGLDDDDDGATDCADSDCVGPECSATLRAQVTGGGSVQVQRNWTGSFDQCAGNTSAIVGQGTLVATGIFGVLERVPDNGDSAVQCAWGFEQATHRFELDGPNFAEAVVLWDPVQRQGFEIDTGCGTSGSAFLPRYLFPTRTSSGAPAGIWADSGAGNPRDYYEIFAAGGALWYYGAAERTDSTSAYEYIDQCLLGWTYGYGARHVNLQPGQDYVTEQ